jgi:hypothetical protein
MSEKEIVSKPEPSNSETNTNGAGNSPFDANALFNQHKKSIVRVSDKINLAGNILDNTVSQEIRQRVSLFCQEKIESAQCSRS